MKHLETMSLCHYVQGVVAGGETKCPDKWGFTVLDSLGSVEYFSVFDLATVYHHIKMDPKESHILMT